jgi:hypothetical protein
MHVLYEFHCFTQLISQTAIQTGNGAGDHKLLAAAVHNLSYRRQNNVNIYVLMPLIRN